MSPLILFLALFSSHCCSGSYTYLKTRFRTEADRERERSFLDLVVNSTRPLLRRPSVLGTDVSVSARTFIDKKHGNEESRVILGIQLENYSKYRLGDAKTSKTANCGRNREINHVGSVTPGSYGLFAVENQAISHRSVCGAFSWQIYAPDGVPVHGRRNTIGRRLIITFDVPYAGACGPHGRFNSFSLNVRHSFLNRTGHWSEPELIETYHPNAHDDDGAGTSAAYVDDASDALALFDKNRFLLHGRMERGCKPLLVVQFLPGSKNRAMLWEAATSDDKKPAAHGLVDRTWDANCLDDVISAERLFFISIVGSVASVVLILAVCAIKKAIRGKENYSPPI